MEVGKRVGVNLLVRDTRRACNRVLGCDGIVARSSTVLLNDDAYVYDIMADMVPFWLLPAPFKHAPRLLAAVTSELVKRASERVCHATNLVCHEPVCQQREWTLWARQFIDHTCSQFSRVISPYARQLASTLLVLRTEKFSIMMTLDTGAAHLSNERTYALVADQATGRIVVAHRARSH